MGGSGGAAASSQPSTLNKRQSMLPQSFSTANISSPATQPPQSSTDRFQPPSYPTQSEPVSTPQSQPPYPVSGPPPQDPAVGVQAPMAGPPPMEKGGFQSNLPPLKPVFGVSLEELYARDGTAVPLIVYQCFQAVELFGLDMEGIYRLSGSANHISHMKAVFDNGKYWQSKNQAIEASESDSLQQILRK